MRLGGEGTVAVRGRDATRWRLEVDAQADGTLVLADPTFPGWRARVDGTSAPIASRIGAPIEVRVPGGRHLVEISYEPLSFRLGVAGAAVALVVLAVVGWCGRRPRPRFEEELDPGSPAD